MHVFLLKIFLSPSFGISPTRKKVEKLVQPFKENNIRASTFCGDLLLLCQPEGMEAGKSLIFFCILHELQVQGVKNSLKVANNGSSCESCRYGMTFLLSFSTFTFYFFLVVVPGKESELCSLDLTPFSASLTRLRMSQG